MSTPVIPMPKTPIFSAKIVGNRIFETVTDKDYIDAVKRRATQELPGINILRLKKTRQVNFTDIERGLEFVPN